MTDGGRETKILESAMDFIHKSIDELRQDLKSSNLKYSIVHFHAGLELLLKARLIKEHWSLVVAKRKHISKTNFDLGNFMSVSFSDSINLINGVFDASGRPEEISQKAKEAFMAVASLRNKILHFYSDVESEVRQREIARKHFSALRYAQSWLKETGSGVFAQYAERMRSDLSQLRKYLEFVYEEQKDNIESYRKKGFYIIECPGCSFDAVKHEKQMKEIHQSVCLVCDDVNNCILIECECGATVPFYSGGKAKCGKCKKELSVDAIENALMKQYLRPRDILDSDVVASDIHCPQCWNDRVFLTEDGDYVCPFCLERTDKKYIHCCDYCDGGYIGEHKEFTWAFGCGACEGAHGGRSRD